MTGTRDYLLRVVCADLAAYERFIKEKLTRLDGLASIRSELRPGAGQIHQRAADPMRHGEVSARSSHQRRPLQIRAQAEIDMRPTLPANDALTPALPALPATRHTRCANAPRYPVPSTINILPKEGAIDALEGPGRDPRREPSYFARRQRHQIGIAPHKRHPRCAPGRYLHDIARQQWRHVPSARASPMQHRASGKVPATAHQRHTGLRVPAHRLSHSRDSGIRTHASSSAVGQRAR